MKPLPHHCTYCEVSFPSPDHLQTHKKGVKHRKRVLQLFYTKRRNAWVKKKDCIEVSVKPSSAQVSEEKVLITVEDGTENSPHAYITLKNVTNSSVRLENVEPLYCCDNLVLEDEQGICHGQSVIQLQRGAEYTITFSARPTGEGCFEVPVFFQFKSCGQVQHQLLLLCIDYQTEKNLKVSVEESPCDEESKIERRRRSPAPPKPNFFLPGKQLWEGGEDSSKFKYLFFYPESLRELVVANFNPKYLKKDTLKNELIELKKFCKRGLNFATYHHWFELQLWINEIENEINLCDCHLNGVEMLVVENVHGEKMVTVEVPSIEEKHPNVCTGDSVFVKLPSENPPTYYEGIVHDIVNCTLHLGFGEEFLFKFRSGMKSNIQFWLQRVMTIRCHNALKHIALVRSFLFPEKHTQPLEEKGLISVEEFFDKRIASNAEQRQAVEAIVNEVSSPAPYIIFGPPGTGKTSTLIEAIKQVYKHDQKNNILVCGPSNASCDILTTGLLKDIPQSKILRVNAKCRAVAAIPQDVKSVSSLDGSCVTVPSLDMVRSYNIAVMTYATSYNVIPLIQEKAQESAFSHVFLDECAYTLETEALIPLLVLPRVVVMAGDPRQLGPVVVNMNLTKTSIFQGFRLDQSYMERLMKLDMYKLSNGVYDKRYITKLLRNYRSHRKILEVPNKLFYDSQLEACGNSKILNSFLQWKELGNKKIPVVFRGVNGRDERKVNNPSYFNTFEVAQVVRYVKELTAMGVKHADIGIVTPYREQMKRIHEKLHRTVGRDAKDIRIGTPEVFQGGERLVIIVSTVRANPERLVSNPGFQLGFLSNPKRFNVAITRARALLVVVGYPWLLEKDEHWGYFLDFCYKNGCYRGCEYDPSEKEILEIEEKFKNFGFKEEETPW